LPYINAGEAHGLSFSTSDGRPTPSLRQIEKAIRSEVYNGDKEYKWNNNLTRWCAQGVLMLNKVLTVDEKVSRSHAGKGWEIFTAETLKLLDKRGVIFMLWGRDAQEAAIHLEHSVILRCEHPQYANYQGRLWLNNNCFSHANLLLGESKIEW
jgi:uracil-DNA glycosylase